MSGGAALKELCILLPHSGQLSAAPRVASNTEVGRGGHLSTAPPSTRCSSRGEEEKLYSHPPALLQHEET